jgi:hypothetical protein
MDNALIWIKIEIFGPHIYPSLHVYSQSISVLCYAMITFISLHVLHSMINIIIVYFFSARDLIKGLLRINPDERLSIKEVMRNQWICVSFKGLVLPYNI